MRILLLEPDERQRQAAAGALRRAGISELSLASNWRQACLLLGQQPYNLALISEAAGSADLVRALRLIQADLRVVLLTANDQEANCLPMANTQGALSYPKLQSEAAALAEALRQRVQPMAAAQTSAPPLPISQMRDVLKQTITDESIENSLIALETGLVVSRGALSERLAAAIAVIVRHCWNDASFPVQVQFLHLPTLSGDHVVYAQRVQVEGHGQPELLLILLARPSTSMGVLREQADRAVQRLRVARDAVMSPAALPAANREIMSDGESGRVERSYAIAWHPVAPLPAVLHIPLRRVLERLANAGSCHLHYLNITPDLVHMVATCPPGGNSIWLAQHFKNGSEAEIQKQFGVNAQLWARGYFARESNTPLSSAEINLFLERSLA
ncbi:MAG: hypothetical protein Fur0021_28290 [Candidatus Promineifilaceae bacterium]